MRLYEKSFKHNFASLIAFTSILVVPYVYAAKKSASQFPIHHYNQAMSHWINPGDPDYDKTLLSLDNQQKRLEQFKDYYVGAYSPWNADYVNHVLYVSEADNLKVFERDLISYFGNDSKSENMIGYGKNLQAHTKAWINKIAINMSVAQFSDLAYQASNRGITINNLQVRVLPTDSLHYYNPKLPGQGYPFDNLQMSALWVGTPVYIAGVTQDKAWMLVVTADYVGWVKSNGIARVDSAFVTSWTKAANNALVAITKTKTNIFDTNGKRLFLAYVGTVFPANISAAKMSVMVPVVDVAHHAAIKNVDMNPDSAKYMPLVATPHNFANIMQTLIGRPYGWGGLHFNSDCSAELKSLFTPFGIWLPRHSSDQMKAGRMVDVSSVAPEARLEYLKNNGRKLLTLVYVGGHVVLYLGNYPDPDKPDSSNAMTYQNVWGLALHSAHKRSVIGGSVLLPMLLKYPEDKNLISQARLKYFQVSYLDQLPE